MDAIGSEVVTELVKQLFLVSRKAYMCRGIAENLATMIDEVQPSIQEILDSGVEMSHHRRNQLHMFFDNLEKCRMLTEKVLRCKRWNMVRQIYYFKKMEDLEKKISTFVRGTLHIHVLADVHHLRGAVDSLNDKLASMKFVRSVSREVDGDLGNLGVGLDLIYGKGKVKKMLFKSNDEGRLTGISGMGGSGKTTLAREIERDEEVRGHFGNRVLFLTVSKSPNFETLRSFIWYFLTGYEAGSDATLPESIGQTRKLVILDDVWTKESLNRLMFENIPGTTTLVVSRSTLADSRATYDVELLNEHEATSLFCLPAFNQKALGSWFRPLRVEAAEKYSLDWLDE